MSFELSPEEKRAHREKKLFDTCSFCGGIGCFYCVESFDPIQNNTPKYENGAV